jgi:dihydrofolate reductase
MSKVFVDVGMSLDGFIAGPNARPGNPLGDGGTRLHQWIYRLAAFGERLGLGGAGETGPDNDLVHEVFARSGAYVMGRRMFDEGEVGWPEDPPFRAPVFVVTHRPRQPWVRPGGTTFTFGTEGVPRALELARAAAGGRDVRISGGASVIRQCLEAGVVDEMTIHLAPVFLGQGVRLFDGALADVALEPVDAVKSAQVTHLFYRVLPGSP